MVNLYDFLDYILSIKEIDYEKESFEHKKEIVKTIAVLSIKNLEFSTLFELIRGLDENQKSDYFNNLEENIISENDFFGSNDSDNLKLLFELMKNKLIPESNYLEKHVLISLSSLSSISSYPLSSFATFLFTSTISAFL